MRRGDCNTEHKPVTYQYADRDGYTDGHCYRYSYSHAKADAYAEKWANAETSFYSAAKTVRVIFTQRLSRSAAGQMTKK
jgi:hypothetical protein